MASDDAGGSSCGCHLLVGLCLWTRRTRWRRRGSRRWRRRLSWRWWRRPTNGRIRWWCPPRRWLRWRWWAADWQLTFLWATRNPTVGSRGTPITKSSRRAQHTARHRCRCSSESRWRQHRCRNASADPAGNPTWHRQRLGRQPSIDVARQSTGRWYRRQSSVEPAGSTSRHGHRLWKRHRESAWFRCGDWQSSGNLAASGRRTSRFGRGRTRLAAAESRCPCSGPDGQSSKFPGRSPRQFERPHAEWNEGLAGSSRRPAELA